MKNLKKLFAGCIAVLMTLSFAGCGGSNDSTKDSESSKQKDKIEVATTKDIADIPEGAEKELLFMGVRQPASLRSPRYIAVPLRLQQHLPPAYRQMKQSMRVASYRQPERR